MRLLILTVILFAFGCADCPSCPKEDPCDFTGEQAASSIGSTVPAALDLDGDGAVTSADFGAWNRRCGNGG